MALVCGVALAAAPGGSTPGAATVGPSADQAERRVTAATDGPLLELGGSAPGREDVTGRDDDRTNRSGGRTSPEAEKDSGKKDSDKKDSDKELEKQAKKQSKGSGASDMAVEVLPDPDDETDNDSAGGNDAQDPQGQDSQGDSDDSQGNDSGDAGNGSSGATGPCPSGSSVEQGLVPNAIKVHRDVCHRWPQITNYGGVRPDSMPEHPSGRALDIMISNNATGWEIANYLRANAGRLGISQVIFDQQIWTVQRSGEGWRGMSDRGGATANHRDHVHVTVYG